MTSRRASSSSGGPSHSRRTTPRDSDRVSLAGSAFSSGTGAAGPAPVAAHPPGISAISGTGSASGVGEQAIVKSLAAKIIAKLPCNSGARLSSLDTDEYVKQAVAFLVDLSRHRISLVVHSLAGPLESLAKSSSTSDDLPPLDVLQSQLFLLKVLLDCLAHNWRCSRDGAAPEPEPEANAFPRVWPDPPALEDPLAKYLLSVMTLFLRQMQTQEDLKTAEAAVLTATGNGAAVGAGNRGSGIRKPGVGLSHSSSVPTLAGPGPQSGFPLRGSPSTSANLAARSSTSLAGSNKDGTGSVISSDHNGRDSPFHPPSNGTTLSAVPALGLVLSSPLLSNSAALLLSSISALASQVVFFLSASNWPVVLARIRNRLGYLCHVTDEAYPDTVELRLIQCACLDRARLSPLISDIASNFLHVKAQSTLSVILRKAIWSWIEMFPNEFVHLIQHDARIEGGPDGLFDQMYALADAREDDRPLGGLRGRSGESGYKKKKALWPTMAMLLVLAPEALSRVAAGDSGRLGSAQHKKATFFEQLRKALRSPKLGATASKCYVDLCRAAALTPPSSRSEASGLRFFAPELINELTDLAMAGEGIFASTGTPEDVAAAVDMAVVLFRMSPPGRLHEGLVWIMRDDSPDWHKVVIPKAFIVLAQESDRMPWYPPVAQAHAVLGPYLRRVLRDVTYRDDGRRSSTRSAPRKTIDEDLRNEILLSILSLWRIDERFCTAGAVLDLPSTSALSPDTLIQVFETLCALLREPSGSYVRISASITLLRLFEAHHYLPPSPEVEQILRVMTCVGPLVMLAFSRQLLETQELKDDENARQALEFVRDFVAEGHAYSVSHGEDASALGETQGEAGFTLLATVVLVSLSSIDSESASIALSTRRAFLQLFAPMRERFSSSANLIFEQLSTFEELEKVDLRIIGRMAYQKRIRKVLRQLTQPTVANLAAWQEWFLRWRFLTDVLQRSALDAEGQYAMPELDGRTESAIAKRIARMAQSGSKPGFFDEEMIAWQACTGCLAALGGSCVTDETNAKPITTVVPPAYLPRRMRDAPRIVDAVDTWMEGMVDLIVGEPLQMREYAKETLAHELSPHLFDVFLRRCESLSAHFEDRNGIARPHEPFTHLIDAFLYILTPMLGRVTELPDVKISVDLARLTQTLLLYAHCLSNSISGLKVKIKFCAYVDALLANRYSLNLGNETELRSALVEPLLDWLSSAGLYETSYGDPTGEAERLRHELDVACPRSLSVVLDGLALQSPDGGRPAESSEVQRRFYRFFQFLVKQLSKNAGTSDEGSWRKQSLGIQTNMTKDDSHLTGSITSALANLLKSNAEVGLRYYLSMGYDESPAMRAAFMRILKIVLDQGQGASFQSLDLQVPKPRANRLVDLVWQPDLRLALSICQICPVSEIEETANVLLSLFDASGQTMDLLKAVIEEEVANTENETALFRRNSMATRLLTAFTRSRGYRYVRATLNPLLIQLCQKPAEFSVELDPSKVKPEDLPRNIANLQFITQSFLDVLCDSLPAVPPSFREICTHMQSVVVARFPDARYTAVGGFVFLRFICPAIVSPETVDLELPVGGRDIRRTLLLITKITQNLANNVLFGAKEDYLTPLNEFLSANIYQVTAFLRDFSSYHPAVPSSRPDPEARGPVDESDALILHRFLYQHAGEIGRELHSRWPEEQGGWGQRTYDELCTVLADLGPPADMPKQVQPPSEMEKIRAHEELTRRNAHRSLDIAAYRNVFYQEGRTREGCPLFHLLLSRINAETTDLDALVYSILTTLEMSNAGNMLFHVLVDCTAFRSGNEIPAHAIQQFLLALPEEIAANLEKIVIVNPNEYLRKYLRKMVYLTANHGIDSKQIIAISSLSDLEAHVSRADSKLSPSIVDLANDRAVSFTPVTRVLAHGEVPVTLKVGDAFFQVIGNKTQDLVSGVRCRLNDVYRLSELDDAFPTLRGDAELVVKLDRSKTTLTFMSSQRDSLVQTIRSAKARAKIGQAPESTVLVPSSVTGTLLNMAFLNMHSEDPDLRASAYDLLCSVTRKFQLDCGAYLVGDRDLCIPSNTLGFLVTTSEKIASTKPELTIDFMREFFVGFERSTSLQKSMCLAYLSPWIPNLAAFIQAPRDDHAKAVEQVRGILRQLIDATAKEVEIYPSMQRKVWTVLAGVPALASCAVDEFVRAGLDGGLESSRMESVASALVALAGNLNIRGKVITRLRQVIARTSIKPTRALPDNAVWNELCVLARMNAMLAFSARLPVQLFFPDLLHIITMLASTGNALLMRTSIHGLAINVVQSLCSSLPGSDPKGKRLRQLLSSLSQPESLALFGLARAPSGELVMPPGNRDTAEADAISANSLAALTKILLDVLDAGAQCTDMANTWGARWMSLVASTAFQFNPTIQARAFIVLGALAREEVDDDLAYQILVTLRSALSTVHDNDTRLMVSILHCLQSVALGLPEDSRYAEHLVWLAIAMIQIGHESIFGPAIELLHVLLRSLAAQGLFTGRELGATLLYSRVEAEACQKLDKTSGIGFEESFSLGFAALVFKGIRHPPTREATRSLLSYLLELTIASQSPGGELRRSPIVDSSVLGYFLALLPTVADTSEQIVALFDAAGVTVAPEDVEGGFGIYDRLDVSDNKTALLVVTFVVAIVGGAESEAERLLLYRFLAESAARVPDAVAFAFDSLAPHLHNIVQTSPNVALLGAVQSILNRAVSEPVFAAALASSTSLNDDAPPNQAVFLEELEMRALPEAGGFTLRAARPGGSERLAELTKLGAELVESIIS